VKNPQKINKKNIALYARAFNLMVRRTGAPQFPFHVAASPKYGTVWWVRVAGGWFVFGLLIAAFL